MVFAFSCLKVELAKLTKNEHSPVSPPSARGALSPPSRRRSVSRRLRLCGENPAELGAVRWSVRPDRRAPPQWTPSLPPGWGRRSVFKKECGSGEPALTGRAVQGRRAAATASDPEATCPLSCTPAPGAGQTHPQAGAPSSRPAPRRVGSPEPGAPAPVCSRWERRGLRGREAAPRRVSARLRPRTGRPQVGPASRETGVLPGLCSDCRWAPLRASNPFPSQKGQAHLALKPALCLEQAAVCPPLTAPAPRGAEGPPSRDRSPGKGPDGRCSRTSAATLPLGRGSGRPEACGPRVIRVS